MATVRFGPIVRGLQGNVGGLVYYEANGKSLIRGQPRRSREATTARQVEMQSSHVLIVRQYGALSPAQVLAWAGFARELQVQPGRSNSPVSGYLAFVGVNKARALAGLGIEPVPPVPVWLAPPWGIESAAVSGEQLHLLLRHATNPGEGFWRVRLTPKTRSPGCQALEKGLRMATSRSADSFLPIAMPGTSVQVTLDPRFRLQPGDIVGLEVVAYSAGYVVGGRQFWRRVQLG